MKSVIAAAGLFAAAQAFTQPVQPPSYGPLLTPNTNSPVTTGQTYQVTWTPTQPADGVTVSLVLCNGPSTNCVLQNTAIVEKVPASAGSYSWSVPCSLPAGVQSTDTGYGMLIIVDGTGQFQYSTQFSVQAGASCGSSSSSSSTTIISTTSSSSSSSSSTSSISTSSTSGTPAPGPSSSSQGWNNWSSSSSISSTTTVPLPVSSTTSKYTSPAAVTTSMVTSTSSYSSYSSHASSSAISSPKPFTGAAAVPTAFVNAAGVMGAAALAVLAF